MKTKVTSINTMAHNHSQQFPPPGSEDAQKAIRLASGWRSGCQRPARSKDIARRVLSLLAAAGMLAVLPARADGELDTGFDPIPDDAVSALAIDANTNVYMGGVFATLDAHPWPYFGMVMITGKPSYRGYDKVDSAVTTVVAQKEPGTVLLAGSFSKPAYLVGRITNYYSADSSFKPNPYGGSVYAIAIQTNGGILIGGSFTKVGGSSGTVRQAIARYNADGTFDSSFNAAISAGGQVTALVVQPDAKILLAGVFTNIGGAARTNLARLNTNGSLDTSFNAGSSGIIHGSVRCMVLQADQLLLQSRQ